MKQAQYFQNQWFWFLPIFIWTLIIVASLWVSVSEIRQHATDIAAESARKMFNMVQLTRLWNAQHGGVYVPVTDKVKPNPYLDTPDRDIETTDGRLFTLINPAFMTRQIAELAKESDFIFHLTSLKPIRPKNEADAWEHRALQSFEQGAAEIYETIESKEQPLFRYMAPLRVKQACLQCHAKQGYKLNDIRGGISVSFPASGFLTAVGQETRRTLVQHLAAYVIVTALLLFFFSRLRQQWLALQEKERQQEYIIAEQTSELRESNERLRKENAARSETEKQLRRSQESLAEAQRITHVGNWDLDLVSNKLTWSDEVYRIFGLKQGEIEISYETFLEYVHPDDRQVINDCYVFLGEQAEPCSFEHRIHRQLDGEIRYVNEQCRYFHDDSGKTVRAIGVIQDISEQKLAELELDKVRHYLNNVIDSMPSMLVGVSNELKVTHWNKEAERLSGVSASDASGQMLDKLLPQLSGEMEWVRMAIQHKEPQKIERLVHQVMDESRYADVMIYPLIMNAEVGAVIRIDDVTERVHMEQLMAQTEKMMSVGGLAAGMAHELNNPLGGILQGLQNIKRRLSVDLKKNKKVADELGLDLDLVHEYLQRRKIEHFMDGMADAGQRASTIVENMLQFSRKAEKKTTKEDMANLIDRTLELASVDYDLKKKYDFRAIEVQRDYEPDLPLVSCVASEIQQVLLNLLRNAAQALNDQKGRIELPQITVRTRHKDNMARIEVEDNGPGMDEETRRRVFEPFYTTRPPGEGTGLGLSVSYFIVHDEHGGNINVESAPGKGAKFIIELPLKVSG